MILTKIDVVRGKKMVTFFFLIKISPGNFPKKGICLTEMSRSPTPKRVIPTRMRNLPIDSMLNMIGIPCSKMFVNKFSVGKSHKTT